MRLSLSSSRSCFRLGYFCWFCFCLCFIPFAVCFTISLAFLCFLLSFCFSPPSVRNAHHFLILFSLCLSLTQYVCVCVCEKKRERKQKECFVFFSERKHLCILFVFWPRLQAASPCLFVWVRKSCFYDVPSAHTSIFLIFFL